MTSPRTSALLLLALIPAALFGQGGEKPSVEGRLLEILRQKGIIDDAEMAELRQIERELRADDDLESRLSAEIDSMAQRVDEGAITTGYSVGSGLEFASPDKRFRLRMRGRIQMRFTHDFFQENAATDDEDEPDFDVPRARLIFQGNAFERWIEYQLQIDVAGDQVETLFDDLIRRSSNRLVELKDGFIEFARWEAFKVRVGQFKAPHSRQFLTDSGDLQFVERTPLTPVFNIDRGVGVMVFGNTGGADDHLLEYGAGLFDGEGENRTNDDKGLLWAGRVALHPFGRVAYTESHLARGNGFRLAVGINAWLHQDDNHRGEGDDWSVGGDVALFWNGFFFTGELHYLESDLEAGGRSRAFGWFAQLGAMLTEKLEVAVRAANIDFDDDPLDTATREYLLAAGYFFEEHALKLQLDFGRVEFHRPDASDDIDGWRLRVQFQIVF